MSGWEKMNPSALASSSRRPSGSPKRSASVKPLDDSPKRRPSVLEGDDGAGSQDGSFRAGVMLELKETERRHSVARQSFRRKASECHIPDAMLGAEGKRVGEINLQLRMLENEEESVFDKGVAAATTELTLAAEHLEEAQATVKAQKEPEPVLSSPVASGAGDVFVRMMQEKMREQQDHARKKLLAAQQNLHQNVSRLKNMQRVHESKEKQLALILSREQVMATKLRRRIEELQVEVDKERELADVRHIETQQMERKLNKFLSEASLNMRQFQFKLMRDLQDLLGKRETTLDTLRSWVGMKQQTHVEAQLQEAGTRLPAEQDPDVLNLRIDKLERINERLKANTDELQVLDRVKTSQIRTLEEKLVELTEKCRGMVAADALLPLRDKIRHAGSLLHEFRPVVDDFRGKVFGTLLVQLNEGLVSRCAAIDGKIQEAEERAKTALAESQRTRAALQSAHRALAGTAPAFHQVVQSLKPAAYTSSVQPDRKVPWDGDPEDRAFASVKDIDREVQAVSEIVLQICGQQEKMRKLEEECKEVKKEAEKIKSKFLDMEQKLATQQAETIKERQKVMQLEIKMKELNADFEKKVAAQKQRQEQLKQELAQSQTELKAARGDIETVKAEMERRIEQIQAEARSLDALKVADELAEKLEKVKDKGVIQQATYKLKYMLKKFGVETKEAPAAKEKAKEPKEPPGIDYQKLYEDLINVLNERGIMEGKSFTPGLVIITASEQAQMGVFDRMDVKDKHSERAWKAKVNAIQTKSKRELEQQLRMVRLEESVAKKLALSGESRAEQLRGFAAKKEMLEEMIAVMPDDPPPTEKFEQKWVQYSMKPGAVNTSPHLTAKQLWGSGTLDVSPSDKDSDSTRGQLVNATKSHADYCRGRLKQTGVKKPCSLQLSSTMPGRPSDAHSPPLSPLTPSVKENTVSEVSPSHGRCARLSLPAVAPAPRQQYGAPPSQVPMAMRRFNSADTAGRAEELSHTLSPHKRPVTTVDLTMSSDEEDDKPVLELPPAGRGRRGRKERSGGLREGPLAVAAREKPVTQWAGAWKLRKHLEEQGRHTAPRSVSMIGEYLTDVAAAISPRVSEKRRGSVPRTCGGGDTEGEGQETSPRADVLPLVASVDQVRKELQQGPAKAAQEARKKNQQMAKKRLKELVPRSRNTPMQLNRTPLELPTQLGRAVCFTLTSTTGNDWKEGSFGV
eukprot:Hpha_TRINITY_DN15871_c1_g9::TRINITY_DN15871_c1_g9_i1::g.187783::m.187783